LSFGFIFLDDLFMIIDIPSKESCTDLAS
jgi:hypothetical protein